MQKKTAVWYIIFTLTYILWGTQIPALKVLTRDLSPILITLLRFGLAALALLPFFLLSKVKVEKKDLKYILVIGLTGTAIFGIVNLMGVRLSTAVNSAVILDSWPLFAAILAPILINEKSSSKGTFAGLIIGLVGLALVVSEGNIYSMVQTKYIAGNLLILLSGILMALYSIYCKRYNEKYGGLSVLFYSVVTGSAFLFLLTFFTGEIYKVANISPINWFLLFWAGVPTVALTWVIWFRGIKEIGLAKANSFFLLIVPSGVFFSVLFLNETLTSIKLIGAALIILGLYVVQTRK